MISGIPGYLDQAHRSTGRARTEALLQAVGLVSAAGGTKHRYYTRPDRAGEKVGYFWRTSARTLRLVRRVRIEGQIKDVPVSAEHYHNKLPGEEWAPKAAQVLDRKIAKAAERGEP